jgi:hypothetical protein
VPQPDTKLITLAMSPRLAALVAFSIDEEIDCGDISGAEREALQGVLREIDSQGPIKPYDPDDWDGDARMPGAPAPTATMADEAARIADKMARASSAAVTGEEA